jgi:hypothetical protein
LATDGSAYVWDLAKGEIIRRLMNEGEVIAAAISPDGARAATGGSGKQAIFWNIDTGQALARIQTKGLVESARVMPEGDSVLLGTYDDALLWKPGSAEAAIILHDGHGPIPSLSITADGKLGVTDSTRAILWDLTTGTKLLTYSGLGPDGTIRVHR